MNLEILRAGNHLSKWSKRNLSTKNLEAREIDEQARKICRMIMQGNYSLEFARSFMGMGSVESLILFYIYSEYSPVSETNLKDRFMSMSMPLIRKGIKGLVIGNLIDREITGNKKQYYITSLGIKNINELLHQILSNNY